MIRISGGLAVAALAAALTGCSANQTTPATPDSNSAPPATGADTSETISADATGTKDEGMERAKPIQKQSYGEHDGKPVSLYTLTNKNGLVMKVMDYGAIVTELHVPDRDGKLADIVLGFENLNGYVQGNPYFGAIVGRVANRIMNAKFKLEGKSYSLAANNKPHHLHGGEKGWDKVVWQAEPMETEAGPALKLTYVSKDGEEGYPGNVTATTIYTLTDANEFKVEMQAMSDAKTLVNMAHHTYWNLGGFNSGPITEHELKLEADQYTPGDPMVPDGTVTDVKGTPFDFTASKVIGKELEAAGGDPIGYDHNFIVRGEPDGMRLVATLKDPKSGRVMTLEADQPGVQFYSGNFLDGTTTGKGITYAQYTGLCLETQKFPNAINVPKWASQPVLKAGETYSHTMVHRFTTE